MQSAPDTKSMKSTPSLTVKIKLRILGTTLEYYYSSHISSSVQ